MAFQLLQKLRNKHFLSLAGNGIMSVLGMLNMIILYRALPVASIGMWVFFLSISAAGRYFSLRFSDHSLH
jgi:O-antigen/teichoic acid export membrane protein